MIRPQRALEGNGLEDVRDPLLPLDVRIVALGGTQTVLDDFDMSLNYEGENEE